MPAKNEKLSATPNKLKEDEIVSRLAADPSGIPDVTAMVGFLGRSPREKFWRVYHTLDLKNYTEIAEADIVQSKPLDAEGHSFGGTVIWVKSGARVQNSRGESVSAEAEFIQGRITEKFLGETGPEGLMRGGGPPVTLTTATWRGPGACCGGGPRRTLICWYPD